MDSGSMDADEGKAVDFIIRTVMDNPGQITIVTIGALTNIAAAIIHEPQLIHNMKGIMMMGGYARTGTLPEGINPIDSNVICDPEAASVVFRSGVPITMVGLDVTYWTAIHREVFRAAFTPGNLLHTALFDLLERWLAHLKKDTAFMHDPFAVAVLIDRTLVKTKKMRVEVEYDHRPKTGTTVATPDEDGNVDVCYELDNDRFRELLLNTLAKS
jgi:purine nucleosidase